MLVAIWGPYTETIETEPFKRHLILAIDTSKSMAVTDDYTNSPGLAEELRSAAGYNASESPSQRPRIQLVRDVLGADRAYLEELARTFRLHVYTFDSAAAGLFDPRDDETPTDAAQRLMASLPQLQARGEVTRVGTAIRDLVRVFKAKNEPVAGILLVSDGRHTGGAPHPVEEAARAAGGKRDGIPIIPVAVGNPATAVNVAVTRIEAPEVVLVGDEVAFTVHLLARGLENKSAELRASFVDDQGGEEFIPIDSPPFTLPREGANGRVTFRHVFNEPGYFQLKIGVPKIEGEAIEGDNFKTHRIQVAKLKMKVLLVSSHPNFTYRFLSEALFRAEKTVEAYSLLQDADPEWPQGATRGLTPLRLFPQTRDKKGLGGFDVVIMLDADPGHPQFAPGGDENKMKVLENIEHWVKQGGGLILRAGPTGNIPRKYISTPVMNLLPVVPYASIREDDYQAIVDTRQDKYYKLTAAGLDHPIMRILKDRELVREFWDSNEYETKYYWYAPTLRTKTSATALAVRRDKAGNVYRSARGDAHSLIALQNYGLGKVLWLASDELWRMRKGVQNLYYWRFWSGAIRHLATYRLLGGNKRIKIWVDRSDGRYRIGDKVLIEAKFLDTNFEPITPADGNWDEFTKTIKLRTPDGEEREIVLSPRGDANNNEGVFTGAYSAGREGSYRLIAEPENDEEPAEASFVVEDFSIEKLNPLPDMKTLVEIAKKSNPSSEKPVVLTLGQFRNLIKKDLVRREGFTRTGDVERKDLWDSAFVLWLFVGLLAVEWILRRLNLLL